MNALGQVCRGVCRITSIYRQTISSPLKPLQVVVPPSPVILQKECSLVALPRQQEITLFQDQGSLLMLSLMIGLWQRRFLVA